MLFETWLMIVSASIIIGEGLNCYYPRLDDSYDSEGMVCSWDEDDFDDNLVLKKTSDDDNCIEEKAREIHWKKRDKNGLE